MKTLTNSSALFKPLSSISHRGHQHKTHFISEHKPKKTLLHLSTRKVTHNIKYPKNDNKTITTTTTTATIHNPSYTNAICCNVVHYKVYEIAIDAFFTFLKHALNTNLYASIKQAFYTEISKATELCVKYRTNTNQSFTLYTHKHTSSISKALLTQQCSSVGDSNYGSNCINCGSCSSSSKPKKTNLKLSYDMYSSNNNSNSNTNSNSNYPKKRATKVSKSNNKVTRSGSGKSGDKNANTNTNSNTRVNNSNNISKKESKQHSLFTLTKHKMFLQSKTQSTSKSHSKSKERKHPQQQQDYFPLNIKLYNKLNREHHHHHHTTNNNNNVNDDINVVTPNTTVVPSLNIKLSHNKHSHFNMLYNSNYFNSSSLNNHNNNNNTNLTTSTNTNRQQQQQHKCSVRKQKQTPTKGVVSSSTKISKLTTQVTCKSCRERKSIQIGNDNNNNNKGGNNNEQGGQGCEKQNSEQLREIKSNLDEDLKVMFNFSYEGFLNKADSESQSKISEISGVSGDGLNGGGKRGKVNGGDVNKQEMIYKRKYDY